MSEQLPLLQTEIQHVLVIEDDVLYATIIGEMLREGTNPPCEVTLKHTAAEGKKALAANRYTIVLLDLNLPDDSGTGMVRALQQINPRIPILVMTNVQNQDTAVAALQAGAQDYLVKGNFKVQSLIRSIRYACERYRLRLELEESLRQRLETVERGFRRLINENADGILVVRPNGRICFTNSQVEALFEQKAADMLGQMVPFDIPQNGVSEIEFLRSDLQVIHMELRAVPIDWEDEPAFLVSLRDITARKEQEGALQTYTEELQGQNEDLEAYARMVAHDLKSPLGIMVGYAEALKEQHEDLTPENLSTYLGLIARSGRKLETIINEMLLLASVRNEKVDVRPLDMAQIMIEVQERLEHMTQDLGAKLLLPDTWPKVEGYKPWIEEVWVNYLTNALKYGGRPPVIRVSVQPQANGIFRFLVTDNGPGISPEDQKKLFTQFPEMSRVRVDGHGLGLSIVRRIVTRLGGQVGVVSEPGQGSTFFFTLPAATPSAATQPANAPAPARRQKKLTSEPLS